MRLDKALSQAGCSRSEAKGMIAKGRVRVDGAVARDPGMNVQPGQVSLDGQGIEAPQEIYLMIHKPAGVVTATEDKRLPTVVSLLPEKLQRRKIGPVGRLDMDVTGLVLLTTNGQLAHRLISPKWKAEKCYRARCQGALGPEAVEAFKTAPALYALAPAAFGCRTNEILFVSSNGWDAIGARWHGFTSFWINREGAVPEQLDTEPDHVGSLLTDVLDRIR